MQKFAYSSSFVTLGLGQGHAHSRGIEAHFQQPLVLGFVGVRWGTRNMRTDEIRGKKAKPTPKQTRGMPNKLKVASIGIGVTYTFGQSWRRRNERKGKKVE